MHLHNLKFLHKIIKMDINYKVLKLTGNFPFSSARFKAMLMLAMSRSFSQIWNTLVTKVREIPVEEFNNN